MEEAKKNNNLLAYRVYDYNPSIESRGNRTLTPFSLLLQTHLPYIYNPPPEIFAQRYSGLGEVLNSVNPIAVLGPD